jgi:hypothetical protein
VWEVHPTGTFVVRPELRDGWLAFDCGDEKRRLAPIPSGWETAPEAELMALMAHATLSSKRGRLIE